MTQPPDIRFVESDIGAIADLAGQVVVTLAADGAMGALARRVNKLTKGALKRLVASDVWSKLKDGDGHVLALPQGMACEAMLVLKLDRRAAADVAERAGAEIAKFRRDGALTILAGNSVRAAEIAFGLALRAYAFDAHKTDKASTDAGPVVMMVDDPEAVSAASIPNAAVVEGVYFTRDLTNEPANVLTTEDFAARLAAMHELGLDVEILEEDQLEALGMRTLLAVGQGSAAPSKVVVMHWRGGASEAPVALVGKGVVFDTGGISLKPAGGMEDMTMDMGGAAVVAGTMRALALRKAPANVVGLVGLVENMPSSTAQRPGDVVRTMKGDTVEVINTDAEGRLVLADVLWHAQQAYQPQAIIDLATLTGAVIIALGHENAGVFANDDALADALLGAAKAEGEGAWRLPLSPAYAKALESRVADVSNVGGRPAGSITAAKFLERFIEDGVPWAHIDIAGVASLKKPSTFAPKGATGWGVRALNRLFRDRYEV